MKSLWMKERKKERKNERKKKFIKKNQRGMRMKGTV